MLVAEHYPVASRSAWTVPSLCWHLREKKYH